MTEKVPKFADKERGIQLLIAEYGALKEEQSSRITLRETALYINIVIFVSFLAYVSDKLDTIGALPYVGLTYISLITFWIYYNNDLYVNKIGDHVVKNLTREAKKLVEFDHTPEEAANSALSEQVVFPWEGERQRTARSFFNRTIKAFALFLSFLAPSALGLFASAEMLHTNWYQLIAWGFALIFVLFIFLGLVELTFSKRAQRAIPE